MLDWEATVVSQYATAPTILRLIENFNVYIDPHPLFDAFYDNVWNIDTAVGYGLDIWGRIVGVSRQLTFNSPQIYFGFNDGIQDYAPFGQGVFSAGAVVTNNFVLSDDAFRTLILIKAAANISGVAAPVLNQFLQELFPGRGRCYVNDLGGMAMRYTFEFFLTPLEVALLTTSGAIPTPTGVGTFILQEPPGSTFGFFEAGPQSSTPFGQGTFLPEGLIIITAYATAPSRFILGESLLGGPDVLG